MNVQMMPVEKIIPYARNPRKNDGAVDAVAASIKEFGFRQPIVVDKENVIIVGHTRYKAAKKLGMTEVPVHVADMDPQKAKAYRLVDNKSNELSFWDDKLLFEEIGDFNFEELGIEFIMPTDPTEEWTQMPEYQNEDKTSFRSIIVHFASQSHVDQFAELLKQSITDKTKSLWYPQQENHDTESKRYASES